MNPYKKRFLGLLFFSAILPGTLAGVNWVLDPSEIYHRSFFYPKCQQFDTVEKNAGYANHYLKEYDAVLFGSSLSMNFNPALLKTETGKTFFMTAGSGMRSQAMMLIARHTFRRDADNRLKTVFWELYHHKNPEKDIVKDNFATYLLNDDLSDDMPYLLSFKTFKNGVRVVRGKCSRNPVCGWRDDPDHRKTAERYKSETSIKTLNEKIAENQKRLQGYVPEYVFVPAVENQMLPLIKEYADKDYVFYMAPVSLADITSFSEEELNHWLSAGRRLLEERNPHIRVFAPVWNQKLITTAAYFRDNQHYLGEINDAIVKEIKEGRRRLTLENYDFFVADMVRWIKNEKMH